MKQSFGTIKGAPVTLYELENEFLVLKVMNYGATVVSIIDKATGIDIVKGYDSAEEYYKGTAHLDAETCADRAIIPAVLQLYERIVDRSKGIRRVTLSCNDLVAECAQEQLSLFDTADHAALEKNRAIQQAVLEIRQKYGKNAVLKGMDLEPAATARERNGQIGGHKSGEADSGAHAGRRPREAVRPVLGAAGS